MKAVITVTGKDKVGIIAMTSAECSKFGVNILDISQTVMQDYFAMIMLTDISNLNIKFADFADNLAALGQSKCLDIRAMHEDIFNSMHRI